ncbi:hypothetical protein [Alteromonas sp. A079]|uniref:hypothetical protein n=1 Tax=Alteromonas sp. A079 TaxID=3410268 RepID=UPI003BA303B2
MTFPNVHMKSKPAIFLNGVLLFVSFQLLACIGQFLGAQATIHSAIDKVERRISLDSAFLDVGNETLSTPVNQYAVVRYLYEINDELRQRGLPIRVSDVQGVKAKPETLDGLTHLRPVALQNAEQTITLNLVTRSPFFTLELSVLAFIASLVVLPVFAVHSRKPTRSHTVLEEILPPKPKLIINLEDKTLSNGVNDTVVVLQNKPLCFYSALVRFCIENPGEPLQPHKDVPHELVNLANKSFSRLIELGHTKRKRPDFNANLDKTLSEIRASLDEVFSEFITEKECYYPPRAQGEGSRSKQHSYALTNITYDDIEFIGN